MRDALAERLLADVMKWTPEDMARERPLLQALATFKYDEYQQFSPGLRFVESLALWLYQFDTDEERNKAYKFIRSRLVFISAAEMEHFVSISFPDIIRPFLIRQTALQLNLMERFVTRISESIYFKMLIRQSLFLGLSDGAHIDLFRRNNPDLSHEQIWQTYEISPEKAGDMLNELRTDLSKILDREPSEKEGKFRMIFLLDDFSASGISYLRKEKDGTYAGKIAKVFDSVYGKGSLNNLIDPDQLFICIVLYVATKHALIHLNDNISNWLQETRNQNNCMVLAVQNLPDEVKLNPSGDSELISLIKKYFDPSIIDKHYRKGNLDHPYLGFDGCALPLIMSHNTPNNSIPLLWYQENKKFRGLFPRVSRHGK